MKNKIFYLLSVILTAFSLQIQADNTLTLENLSCVAGKQAVLHVGMNNSDAIVALSFEITLPDGVTINNVAFSNSRKPKDGSLTTNSLEGNTTIVAEYSNSNGAFTGTSGNIFDITLDISSSVTSGDYTITIANIELANENLKATYPANVSSTLSIKKESSSQTIAKLTSVGSPSANDISAAGGSERAQATAYYEYWTRTFYTDNTYSDGNTSSSNMTIYGEYINGSNLGSTVTGRTKIGTSTPSGQLPYNDENGNTITATATAVDIYQAANSISSYDEVKLSFTTGTDQIKIVAGQTYDLSNIIKAEQNAVFASGAKGSAEVELFYNVQKTKEGFDPLQLTEENATVSAQATADASIANGYTVRVLGLGEGNKVACSDAIFTVSTPTNVNSAKMATDGTNRTYDLNGRMIPVNQKNFAKGIYVVGDKKVVK